MYHIFLMLNGLGLVKLKLNVTMKGIMECNSLFLDILYYVSNSMGCCSTLAR